MKMYIIEYEQTIQKRKLQVPHMKTIKHQAYFQFLLKTDWR